MPDDAPILNQLNLIASDVEASVAFYRLLGLEFTAGAPEWEPHHRTVEMADGVLLEIDSEAFARTWNQGTSVPGRRAVIGFELPDRDSVNRLYERLTAAGYRGAQRPYDAFWGSRYAVVDDPDGNPVGLMSPSDPAWRTPPPEPPAS